MDGSGVAADINALVIGMIGMFFLTLVIIFFVVIYQRKLLNQERKHKEAEEIHQLELLQATLESQEKERDRIGRELHDGVGVLLTTVRMYLEHLGEAEMIDKASTQERIDQILTETIESVRRVSSDLRPVVLENLGLAEAIADLIKVIEKASFINIQFTYSYKHNLSLKDELSIYRVVQELLTNGLRHSGASEIDLELNSQSDFFSLYYKDNGKGIDQSLLEKKGLGLKNIESRINALKGKWVVKSPPEGGLIINIQIENYEYN